MTLDQMRAFLIATVPGFDPASSDAAVAAAYADYQDGGSVTPATVPTPTMAALATLDDLKAYSSITVTTDDDMLTRMISAASSAVRRYCGRDFTVQSYSRLFDGRNQVVQLLPQYPIISIDAVSIDDRPIAVGGYVFDDVAITLRGWRFARGWSNIAIAWTAGYDPVPDDVAQAVIEWVGLRYALRGMQGYASKSLAGETVSFVTKAMPDSVKAVLDGYTSSVVA